MTTHHPTPEQEITRAVVRLNAVTMGLVLGILFGLMLFVATAWLVIKGGPDVGPHLKLLAQYFPGYTVTWGGSIVGLFYGFLTGFIAGSLLGAVYNKLAR